MKKSNRSRLLCRILTLFALLFIVCLAFVGCSDNQPNTNGGGTSDGGTSPDDNQSPDGGNNGESYSLKVLFIGDNSTLDASKFLENIIADEGIGDALIATLNHKHAQGASVADQVSNAKASKKAYTYTKSSKGSKEYEYSKTLEYGLKAEAWDVIVIGQSIPLGADADSYEPCADYVKYVKANITNADARIMWLMGWALGNDVLSSSDAPFSGTSQQMHEEICALTYSNIEGVFSGVEVLPVGTALSNLQSTVLGDFGFNSTIRLQGEYGDLACYASSLVIGARILSKNIADIDWAPSCDDVREKNLYSLSKEAAIRSQQNKYETNAPEVKTMKLLIFGNSYGNDAMAYFEKILNDAGYLNVIIGHAGESSMAINDHYHNIDDDPTNDYIYKSTGKPFSVHHKTVNGVTVDMPADYKKIVADEDWDIITFYQGPNSMDTLTQDSYYSELNNFLAAIKAYSTNPDCKIVYYMPWAHGSTTTDLYHGQICDVTERLFADNPNIDGIIPAGTVIENLRTSYLSSATDGTGDINRDWGHLNYGVGRYAIALTFYAYLTGGSIDGISYLPTADEITSRPFTDPGKNIDVIREAVKAALANPFEITESIYKEKP